MIGLAHFLAEMKTLGIELWLEGDALKYRAPKGVLTPKRLEELRSYKALLLDFLASLNGAPIPRVEDGVTVPLSNAQRRLWVLCQLDEGAAAYTIPLHQELRGAVDLGVLEQAFRLLQQRHDSLRTCFPLHEGEPWQQVDREPALPFQIVDLRDDANREERAAELGRAHARQVFDLEKGPLFDVTVLRLEDERVVVLFTVHHIVSDGVSIGVLARDLSAFYVALGCNRTAQIPALSLQYCDYTVWQQAWLKTRDAERNRAYWHETLHGRLPVLNMPTDFPRPPQQTFDGREVTTVLDAILTGAIQECASKANASLFVVLLAWVSALLHRYTHQDDIILGSPFAGRDHPDLNDQVGFYVNTVPLRLSVAPGVNWEEHLRQARSVALGAMEHPYPLDELVPELNVERDFSRSPLFDVCLILQNQSDAGLQMGDLHASSFFEHPGTSKFDLTFCFKMVDDRLVLALEYNTRLFSVTRIEAMITHLQTLANGVLADPAKPITESMLLAEDEKKRLLVDWNQTRVSRNESETTLDSMLGSMQKHAEKTAVRFANEQMSYAELDQRSTQIAQSLREHGAKAGQFVGVYLHRCLDLPAVLLGVWKAGCAYIPLDPAFPNERLSFMLGDAQAKVLVTQHALADDFAHTDCTLLCIEDIDGNGDDTCDSIPKPADLAYAIYTSGSTGKPKGVCIPHGALLNFLLSMREEPGFGEDDRLLAVTTISFDISALELFLPLLCGGEVILASQEDSTDAFHLMKLLDAYQPTVMQATPATWRMLLEAGWSGASSLSVLCGGEALPRDLAQQLGTKGNVLWNLYGPTETTIWSCIHKIEESSDTDAVLPIGHPIANTTIYIVDAAMNPVPVGVTGELLIGGEGLAVGYYNRDELTREKFIANPFTNEPGERLYRTGDVARWRNDGILEFLGRMDHQVKVRGFRIETGEIETRLTAHESIQQAVVVLYDPGNGDAFLVAYLVASEPVQDAALREWVWASMPEYMVPAQFVRIDEFPLTPNGKVDRKALPSPGELQTSEETIVAPRNETEEQLLGLWKSLLNRDRLGIDHHFFEQGGHSILATRLAYQIQRELSVELSLRDVFEHPTVASMAEHLRAKPVAKPEAIQAIDRVGEQQSDSSMQLTPEELELLDDEF